MLSDIFSFERTFTGQVDYLDAHTTLNHEGIRAIRSLAMAKASDPRYGAMHAAIASLPDIKPTHLDFTNDVITIGCAEDIGPYAEAIEAMIKAFIPWKKGPFSVFGTEIDAEWRSDLKWNRVLPHLGSLAGHRVADIGSNNGYYMYRMLPLQPELVIGFEPENRHAFNFKMLQHFARQDALHFEPLGVEHMDLYPAFFDTVFCMGILYHHADPIGLLRKILASMKKGGQIIIECQGIPGEDPVALMPENRYARGRGFWWLPTRSCLAHWMQRSGFREIEFFADVLLTSEEQRSSKFAPIESLEDFLDKDDRSKTIEGYPAPRRFYLKARKP